MPRDALMNLDGSDRVLGSSEQARALSSPLGIQEYSHPKNLWLGDQMCTVILSLTETSTSSNKGLIIN